MASFNGLGMHMGNLAILSAAESRSISPENPTGEKGRGAMATPDPAKSPARKLGLGWKVAPYIMIEPGEVKVLADIAGAGAIQQIWMTPTGAVALEHLANLLGRIAGAVGRMPGR